MPRRYQSPDEPSFFLQPATALRRALRHGYTVRDLRGDVLAGIVVSIVALPLSMALAVASGVAPAMDEKHAAAKNQRSSLQDERSAAADENYVIDERRSTPADKHSAPEESQSAAEDKCSPAGKSNPERHLRPPDWQVQVLHSDSSAVAYEAKTRRSGLLSDGPCVCRTLRRLCFEALPARPPFSFSTPKRPGSRRQGSRHLAASATPSPVLTRMLKRSTLHVSRPRRGDCDLAALSLSLRFRAYGCR